MDEFGWDKKNPLNWVRYFLGFYRNPPEVSQKLKDADVRSATFLSLIVGLIEIFMLIRYTVKYGAMCDTIGEFLQYTYGYWILLTACILLLIYSITYFRGMPEGLKKRSTLFIAIFFTIGIYFGATTSLSDFARGRMILCFLSIIMYVTIILIKRPIISILLTIAISWGFHWILNTFTFDKTGAQVVMNAGDHINYATFMVSLMILEVSVYFQRFNEAWQSFKLEKASVTDDLTGISNMHRFEEATKEYAAQCLAEGKHPIYLVFNIQHFQTYNDRFNYNGGDELLIELGRVLIDVFGKEPVARESGDTFTVLTCANDYINRASRVRERIRSTHPTETYLDVKVGAYRAKDMSRDARHAIDRARHALRKLHNREDEFFLEYDEKMSKEYSLKQYVLNHVEEAVQKGYIKVYYQPVLWSDDATLAGCEALARWIDPEMGFMSPGLFIPTLEEGRQIHKLDLCIYENVCRNIRECLDKGLPVLPTSLNFSRLDFELMDAVGELDALVQKYNVPKQYLHVEITESAVTKNVQDLKNAMQRLHDLGYAIWLDDFGSGYSSMNVLKDLDFDLLKIDMEFLKNFHGNMNSRKIISSVINLAEALNMRTLCEGVETEEAVEFLRQAGCGRLQGYYYGKPMVYAEIIEKIKDGTYRVSDKQEWS